MLGRSSDSHGCQADLNGDILSAILHMELPIFSPKKQ